MPNYNRVILLGHLTRDPELSYTPSQTAIVDFGMAVNRTWKDSDGNEQKAVCFVDCQAFGRNAENLNKYSHKGDCLHIEGYLKFESWKDKEQRQRSRIRIVVERFQFVSTKKPELNDSED